MQSWFFLENKNIPRPKKRRDSSKKMSEFPVPEDEPDKCRDWKFLVKAPELNQREKVFITGNITELGEWDHERLVSMEYDPAAELWVATVSVPDCCDFDYRYAVCHVSAETIIIRKWETNIKPRVLKGTTTYPIVDTFGEYDGKFRINTGWLSSETILQFKFINNPLKLKSRLHGRLLNIKVTPVKLSFGSEPHAEDSSLSMDNMDVEIPPGVIVEVATLNNDLNICALQLQEQFGRTYKPDDVLLINVSVPRPEGLAYLVDFYSYSSRAATVDPPCHVGYTYVLPNMFKQSEGSMELPVSCNVKHRPLGTVNIEYLIVRPMVTKKLLDLQVSYAKHWDPSWTGLEVGHRGLGASFKTKE